MSAPRHRVVVRRHYWDGRRDELREMRNYDRQAAPRASSVVVGLLLAALLACVAYRVGYLAGADDGWWSCMAEHGEVA